MTPMGGIEAVRKEETQWQGRGRALPGVLEKDYGFHQPILSFLKTVVPPAACSPPSLLISEALWNRNIITHKVLGGTWKYLGSIILGKDGDFSTDFNSKAKFLSWKTVCIFPIFSLELRVSVAIHHRSSRVCNEMTTSAQINVRELLTGVSWHYSHFQDSSKN